MGCGRVGSALAQTLEQQGHTVAVVDQDQTAFRRLGSGFAGRRVTGVGFDQDTLREAGIEEAGAFAAVSSGEIPTSSRPGWPARCSASRTWSPGSTTPA